MNHGSHMLILIFSGNSLQQASCLQPLRVKLEGLLFTSFLCEH